MRTRQLYRLEENVAAAEVEPTAGDVVEIDQSSAATEVVGGHTYGCESFD